LFCETNLFVKKKKTENKIRSKTTNKSVDIDDSHDSNDEQLAKAALTRPLPTPGSPMLSQQNQQNQRRSPQREHRPLPGFSPVVSPRIAANSPVLSPRQVI
jgi:hypothetical protein